MKIITQTKPNRLLLDNELPPTPRVAIEELGHTAAGILQQIYFLSTVKGEVHRRDKEGRLWYYFPLYKWAEIMVRSVSTIKRAIATLVKAGFIYIERLAKHEWYQCNYYSINYEAIKNDFVLGPYYAATGSEVIQDITQGIEDEKSEVVTEKPETQEKSNPQIAGIIKRASEKALIPTPELDAEIEIEKTIEAPKSLKMALAIATGLPEIKESDEVVLPHHDQLEKLEIDTQNPQLVKAVKEASDSYLSIQAWLTWVRSHDVKSPIASLISALKKNWRPMTNASDNHNDYAPQPVQLRIPDMPEALVNYLKGSRAKEIKEAFWSQVEKQWIVRYNTNTHLPWYKALVTYPEFDS